MSKKPLEGFTQTKEKTLEVFPFFFLFYLRNFLSTIFSSQKDRKRNIFSLWHRKFFSSEARKILHLKNKNNLHFSKTTTSSKHSKSIINYFQNKNILFFTQQTYQSSNQEKDRHKYMSTPNTTMSSSSSSSSSSSTTHNK